MFLRLLINSNYLTVLFEHFDGFGEYDGKKLHLQLNSLFPLVENLLLIVSDNLLKVTIDNIPLNKKPATKGFKGISLNTNLLTNLAHNSNGPHI